MRLLVLVLWASLAFSQGTYTTSFPATENPISEGNRWLLGGTDGTDWADVRTDNGRATGKENGLGADYKDGTAILKGTWGANQSVMATVGITGTPSTTCNAEVELRLRSAISANVNRGYEVAWAVTNNYLLVVRWNGAVGAFDIILNTTGTVVNGDSVRATMSADTIYTYKNGSLTNTVKVTSISGTYWSDGAPGIGFNNHGCAESEGLNWGFEDFSASDGKTFVSRIPAK